MKRVIVDYFRRRAWVFGIGALALIVLGWGQAEFVADIEAQAKSATINEGNLHVLRTRAANIEAQAKSAAINEGNLHGQRTLAANIEIQAGSAANNEGLRTLAADIEAQAAFAAHSRVGMLFYVQIQLGVFLGAFLLMSDLHRGIARILATLPLSAAQIGRAWWMATVAVPAVFFCPFMTLGVALYHAIHPGVPVAWQTMAGSALSLLLVLGASFTLMFKAQGATPEQGWRRVISMLASLVWVMLTSSVFLLFGNLSTHPALLIFFLVVGVSLTVIGWFQAETFVRNRAGFRIATENGPSAATASSPALRIKSLGGIPLLIAQNVGRAFLFSVVIFPSYVLMSVLGFKDTWTVAAQSAQIMFFAVLFFTLSPVLLQLRHLRTLPLSSSQLALVLLTITLLPLLVTCGLTTVINGWALGEQAALRSLQVGLLMVAFAAFTLAYAVWLGFETATYLLAVCTVTLVIFSRLSLHTANHQLAPSLELIVTAAVGMVVIAFFIVRLALQSGTRTYRAPTYR